MTKDLQARKLAAARILALVDLTSLGDDDQPADIERLCSQAVTPHGSVASVCVWPQFVAQSAAALEATDVRICAVANFPAGDDDVELATSDARNIVDDGGDEVDVVVPWRSLAAGADGVVERLVAAVRSEIGPDITLKAILETGELEDARLITAAAVEALAGGADFLKTSTGKTEHSASPAAAATLIEVLKAHRSPGSQETQGAGPGLKISGGVASVDDAMVYLDLADAGLGPGWVSADTMRFGASRLLGDLIDVIGKPSTD